MKRKQKIKALRMARGISAGELGERIGKSRATIYRYENGDIEDIPATVLRAIAKELGTTLDDLIDWQDADEFAREIEANEPPEHVWIPIVGRVAAGQPMYAEDNIEGYLLVDSPLALSMPGSLFALRIAGDSMEPEIKKGSIALVRHQEDADTGDVVIVRVNGEDATCKRIKKTAAGLTLLPANPAYDMQSYTWAEVAETPVSIVGKVIEVRTKY